MRILLIHNRYRWSGGEETTVQRLHAALESVGQDVCRLETTNPHSTVSSLKSLALAPWNHGAERRVRKALDRFSPHVVHVHNTWFSLSPAVFNACHHSDVPVVTTIQNYRLVCPEAHLFRDGHVCTECVGRAPLPGIKHRCYRGSGLLSALSAFTTSLHEQVGSWARIDRVHVPSRFARSILEAGPFSASQFVVFPNAVEDPGPRPQAPSASRTILFVGRLSKEKGLDLVLRGWQRVMADDIELVVVGDGPNRLEWEQMAPEGVRFLGRMESGEVAKLMRHSRALVFPSKWFEVCPMVIVEALAAGLPVVGHDLGAITELIDFGSPESLVDPDDERGWEKGLSRLTNDVLVDKLGSEARERYLQRHTIAGWMQEHLTMYQSVIS